MADVIADRDRFAAPAACRASPGSRPLRPGDFDRPCAPRDLRSTVGEIRRRISIRASAVV